MNLFNLTDQFQARLIMKNQKSKFIVVRKAALVELAVLSILTSLRAICYLVEKFLLNSKSQKHIIYLYDTSRKPKLFPGLDALRIRLSHCDITHCDIIESSLGNGALYV